MNSKASIYPLTAKKTYSFLLVLFMLFPLFI